MSSDEEYSEVHTRQPGSSRAAGSVPTSRNLKKRKLMRACDACRKKKIKCDAAAQLQGEKTCTYCKINKLDCTFLEDAEKRSPPKGYIEDLERRCQVLEEIISRIAPDFDLQAEAGPSFTRDTWSTVATRRSQRAAPSYRGFKAFKDDQAGGYLPSGGSSMVPSPRQSPELDLGMSRVPSILSASSSSQDPKGVVRDLESGLNKMNVSPEKRHHSKFAGIALIHAALNLKHEVEQISGPIELPLSFPPGSLDEFTGRSWFWKPCQWEYLTYNLPAPSSLKFPPPDLASSLISLCFDKALVMYPVLHRPTFERDAAAGLHIRDLNFAKLYLLVCALGSRYSIDARVALKAPFEAGGEPQIQWRSAGWSFFQQVMSINRPALQPAELCDLQVAALSAIYLDGSGSPYATAWLLAGNGLRLAQDIGVHSESFYTADRGPFENQMWKRAFWSLVALERINGCGLGRPLSMSEEIIDAEMPLEVDDEYYDEAGKQWIQPPGKPSRLEAFTCYVRLTNFLAKASDIRITRWASNHTIPSVLAELDVDVTKAYELDAELTRYFNSFPNHLRWDESITDEIRFEQTMVLQFGYHHVQTILHHPLLPLLTSHGSTSILSSPSLAICRDLSRTVSRILEVRARRRQGVLTPYPAMTLATGMTSLINIWIIRKTGLNVDVSAYVADVNTCLKELRIAEERWHVAGTLCDILAKLAGIKPGANDESSTQTHTARKRARENTMESGLSEIHGPQSLGTSASILWVPPASVEPQVSQMQPTAYVPGHQGLDSSFSYFNLSPMSLPTDQWSVPWVAEPSFESHQHRYHLVGPQISAADVGPLAMPSFSTGGMAHDLAPDSVMQDILGGFTAPSGAAAQPTGEMSAATGSSEGMNNQDWSWIHDLGLFNTNPNPAAPPP